MPKRAPSAPPTLSGFTPIDFIGSGGYADVFLYEQAMPNRQVAVKVLVAEAMPHGIGADVFTDEANLMARVSAHPYIVQVFQADIAPDGRPFLVMEYYPGANYADRAKREQISVAEVLRTGIQLSSAIETAHRAGIFHRDIKPANVLTSEYYRPGLTDFGIASAAGPTEDASEGVSIPWAPPEAFGEAVLDASADVYSLAATMYNLLVGRSPFEIANGDNSQLALMARVERSPVPPIGRADVPLSLERVLTTAMSKDRSHRPNSAAEFGRQLQGVESELKLAGTPLELADGSRAVRARVDVVDDDSTRVKGVAELHAQPTDLIRGTADASSGQPIQERRREGILAEPEISETVVRPAKESVGDFEDLEPSTINKTYLYAGAAAIVLILVVGVTVLLGGSGSNDSEPELDDVEVNDGFDSPIAVAPPTVGEIVALNNNDGSFTFTWTSAGDGFDYLIDEGTGTGVVRVSETTFTSSADCIEVETVAQSGLISSATRGCA